MESQIALVLTKIKHLAGRHDQHTHAPRSGYGMLSGGFIQGKNQRIFVAKTKGGGKVTVYGDQAGVDIVKEVLDHLPKKAVDILESSKQHISFWYEPEYLTRQSSKDKILGQYSYTPFGKSLGQHRVVFSNTHTGIEEFAHMLDKEMGIQSGKAGEFSLSKRYQGVRKSKEGDVVGRMAYSYGRATEDFAKALRLYVTEPKKLDTRWPKHYALMQELFGE